MAARKSKKGHRNEDRSPRRLFKRGSGPPIPPGSRVVHAPAGHEKMSEVLEEFIEPYLEFADTEDKFRKLLDLGTLVWNAALLPEGETRAMIDKVMAAAFTGTSEADPAQARELRGC